MFSSFILKKHILESYVLSLNGTNKDTVVRKYIRTFWSDDRNLWYTIFAYLLKVLFKVLIMEAFNSTVLTQNFLSKFVTEKKTKSSFLNFVLCPLFDARYALFFYIFSSPISCVELE